MTILAALNWTDDVEVLAITTMFGNAITANSTRNAHALLAWADRPDIPVATGAYGALQSGGIFHAVSDFVHGADGLGDIGLLDRYQALAGTYPQPAAVLINETLRQHPGEVTILALASLTNVALAMALNPEFNDQIGEVRECDNHTP